ncbi:glycerol-3-phosphate dehydrogenase 1-like protein [Pagrus major]|uniref:glycerol-3-phosphate dehydrogenase 1-like protein n=1 Tax=Pagrus major TaxID=143350 RepID=UPI003CC8AE8E
MVNYGHYERLRVKMLRTRSVSNVLRRLVVCYHDVLAEARGGVAGACEGRAEPRLEARRADEEVLTGEGEKEQQGLLQFGRTGGTSTSTNTNTNTNTMPPKKVCIVGSGNWGSSIAKIIGHNVKASNRFDPYVNMWVYEEMIEGKKLTEIINTEHENVKYLPGHKLPRNVVAVPEITEAVKGAKILVFVIPHQFIAKLCDQIKPHITEGTIGISLIKGIDEGPDGLKLISDIIREKLEIEVSVLMGANIANEVADEKFCETTIGAKNEANGVIFKELLQTPNFRITVVQESDTVELCGALKNIVAVGAGFCDGLGFGDNTKAAVIRLGLMEMVAFAKLFCKGEVSSTTFLESCGVADLITTCYGGRNRKVAEAFAKTSKSIAELEEEMLNGQKLQGPQTSAEVYKLLQKRDMVNKFPLFSAVYQICFKGKEVKEFITCLQNHPEHM